MALLPTNDKKIVYYKKWKVTVQISLVGTVVQIGINML